MANRNYLGHAAGVKQVDLITVANTWAAADTITPTIDNISAEIEVGADILTTEVATTLKQGWNGETLTDTTAAVEPNSGIQSIGQFAEIEASVSGSVVSLTARTASRPFTLSVAESTAGDGTATESTPTQATGPTFFSNADNWSGNATPTDNDTVIFDQPGISVRDGLSPGIQLAALYHWMTFTGWIGRPERNVDNPAKPYNEYRTRALTTNNNAVTTTYHLGMGSGQGAEGIRLNAGAGQADWRVYASRQMVNGIPNITLQGTHASNSLINMNGTVGIAYYSGEATTLASLTNGREDRQSNAHTICGPDATLTSCTINMLSGRLETNSAVSVINLRGGEMIHGAGAITTLRIYSAGKLKIRSAAAITITTGYIDGILDLSETAAVVTFTNCEFGPNAIVLAPNGNIAFTNPYTEENGFSKKRQLNFGTGRTYALT